MHFRRWRKGAGRQGKQDLHASIELGSCGKQAIVAASWRCGEAVRYFSLHHDHNGLDILALFKQPQQNVRGKVIGKICYHVDRFRLELVAVPRTDWFRSKDSADINGKNFALYNLYNR